MDWRNRLGLYGAYFCGMAGIGFTLPYLPLYLGQRGLSDRAIGIVSTLAAISALAQFAVGVWSDRVGRRKPFLLASLAVLALATAALPRAPGGAWLVVLVVLFAENGVCRAVLESQTGAEAVALAAENEIGGALGGLRFWKPIAVILVAFASSYLARPNDVGAVLVPLAFIQALGFAAACLIHEPRDRRGAEPPVRSNARVRKETSTAAESGRWRDAALWAFIAAMVLFHTANAPGGVYLGLFLARDLHAANSVLALAFVVSMVAWALVVAPAGKLADRWGRRPLLIMAWAVMSARLLLVSVAETPGQVVAIQALDGLANGLFAVVAAAWATDRLGGARRAGEAQAVVGTSLVLGSALGPALSAFLVDALGYRGLFAFLATLGAVATVLVVAAVPESLRNASALEAPGRGETERKERFSAADELAGPPAFAIGETTAP